MKIGTIGSGFIVDWFLTALNDIEGASCEAVYSRKEETAKPLADKYQIEKIYTDLNQMFADPSIEFIYIASPNSLHFEHAFQALNHGKHVICEKPFTSTAKEAKTLIELAKQNQLMLFEAISNIHLPNYQAIKEEVKKLGKLKFVQCNYSQYSSRYNKLLDGENPNVFNPAFSGGALADINIYNLHFVMNLFGVPDAVSYTANIHENGIDTSGVLVMKYPDFIAECVGAKDSNSMNFGLIQGENGYVHVQDGANVCKKVISHIDDEVTEINSQTKSNWLIYELAVFKDIFNSSNLAQCYELLDYSYEVMKVFEQARKNGGIYYPADQK
ncbi:Gfo/Idh/MocA family protein [Oceanobacillus sojae]|uniref:Gfo/Idh/MocA family protein n=1 Tax=Oceanobacillus sojae TaxID=582851 RepID=UPI0021A89EE4|nr:Gfo/Idh/MocA family oxidoreductase [Oceanobacillus sojae]MCT1901509.1 Gfo/Idh/MocA family oxidoreductase [Oceanobacillus sojae]